MQDAVLHHCHQVWCLLMVCGGSSGCVKFSRSLRLLLTTATSSDSVWHAPCCKCCCSPHFKTKCVLWMFQAYSETGGWDA